MSKGGNLLSETTAVFKVREAYPHWHRGRNQGTLPSSPTPWPNHPQVPGLNLTYVGQSPLFLKRKMSAAVQTWQGFFLEAEGQLSMNLVRVAGHFNPGWIKEKTGTVEGLPQGLSSKESLQCRRHRFHPWIRKISWRREWQPTPVFLPGKSQGQRSLTGYSPWGGKETRHSY